MLVTIMADSTSFTRLRFLLATAAIALALQSAVAGVLVTVSPDSSPAALGSVTFDQNVLLEVNIQVGAVVLLGLLAASFGLLAWSRPWSNYVRRLAENNHGARWIVFSLTSSITVFLVAQLNGITDIGTLVLIYAATSTMTLFSLVQERMPVGPENKGSHRMLPLMFGAAIGIVPWGIIAFWEIAASIAGNGPPAGVRILTLLMLAAAISFALANWSEQRRAAQGVIDVRGEQAFIVLSAVGASVFAWAVLLTLS
jgi:hypothetical protein